MVGDGWGCEVVVVVVCGGRVGVDIYLPCMKDFGKIGFHGWSGGLRDGWVRGREVASVSTVGGNIFGSWLDVDGLTGWERSWWRRLVGFGFWTCGGAGER